MRVVGAEPPWVSSLGIASWAQSVPGQQVPLNNSCGGAPTYYMASESATFSGATWQAYSTSPMFTLSAGGGQKTVYFKVKNAYFESAVASDTIVYGVPTNLTVSGNAVTGSIAVAQEEDWYTFTASVTGAYTLITQKGTLTNDCVLFLYGPSNYTSALIGWVSQGVYTVTSPGLYYVRVSSWVSSSTGTYTMRVVGDVPAPTNQAPVVNAGADQTITLPAAATLSGTVSDDGWPSNLVVISWNVLSGPGTVTFTNTATLNTRASFSTNGVYVLRLKANDGALASYDDVQITVNPAPVAYGPFRWGNGFCYDISASYFFTSSLNRASFRITADATRVIDRVFLCTARGGAAQTYTVALCADTNGLPGATLSSTNFAPVSGSAWSEIDLPNVSWTSGQVYHLVMYSAGAPCDPTNNTQLWFPGSNTVGRNVLLSNNGGSSWAVTNREPAFRVLYTNGVSFTQPYVYYGIYGEAYPMYRWGQTFTPSQSASITNLFVWLQRRNSDSNNCPILRVWQWSNVSNKPTAFVGASTSVFPTMTWNTSTPMNFRFSPALQVGGATQYFFEIVPSTTNGGYWMGGANALGNNTYPGFGPYTWDGTNDCVRAGFAGSYTGTVWSWSNQRDEDIGYVLTGYTGTPPTPTNQAPAVNAGADQAITLPATATLSGTATDDGLPSNRLAIAWSSVSGPGAVAFANATSLVTTASFSTSGVYVLRLTANDTVLSASDDLQITVNAAVDTNWIVGKWSFEQTAWTGAVGEVTDSSAFGNHGRAVNGPVPTNGGVSGKAAALSTTNGYIEVPNSSSLQVAGSLSVSFWIKPDNIGSARLNPVDKSYGGEFALTIETDGRLSYYHGTAQSTSNYWGWTALPAKKLVNTLWQHVTIVRDATSNRVSSYYNGVLVSQATYSTATNLLPKASTSPVRFGRGYTGASLKGRLDEVQIVSRPLTSAEVLAMYTTNRPPNQAPYVNAQPDLVVTWPASASLNGAAADDGLPSNLLSTVWSKVSGTGTVTFANATSLVTTAGFSTSGVYVLRLTASDTIYTSTDLVTVTANQAPVVNAGSNQTVTLPAGASLAATMWDDAVPSNRVTVQWGAVSGPGPVVFSSSNTLTSAAYFSSSGVYVLRFTASDTLMASTGTVTVTVNSATGTVALQQSGGYQGWVVLEAEQFGTNVAQGGYSWTANSTTGFSGTGAMAAMPNSGTLRDSGYTTNCPRMDYLVNFRKTGTHQVWVRGLGATTNDDSCHIGLDGAAVSTADKITGFTNGWGWSRSTADGPVATLSITNTGLHTIHVWMREDGFVIDKIALSTNPLYVPTSLGPPAGEVAVSWIDGDGDGLSDWEEVNTFGSNPLVRDTDGDGLLDGSDPRPTTANVAPVMQSLSMTSTGNFHGVSAVVIQASATDEDGEGVAYQFAVDGAVVRSWAASASATWTPGTNSVGYRSVAGTVRDSLSATNRMSKTVYIFRAPPTP